MWLGLCCELLSAFVTGSAACRSPSFTRAIIDAERLVGSMMLTSMWSQEAVWRNAPNRQILPAHILNWFLFGVVIGAVPALAVTDASREARIDNLIHCYEDTLPRLWCTKPWELAHETLPFGDQAAVMLVDGSSCSLGEYLLTRARRPSGMPLFDQSLQMGLWPSTDPIPQQLVQDHPNQILAYLLLSRVERGECLRPPRIPVSVWQRLVAGVWCDYALDKEPSWTLISYTILTDSLPAPRQDRVARSRQMALVLIHPPAEMMLACNGAHALLGLTLLRRDPAYSELGNYVTQDIDGHLASAARDCLRWRLLVEQSKRDAASGSAPDPTSLDRVDRTIGFDGHSLEWLSLYLRPDQLRSPPIEGLVDELCLNLEQVRGFQLSSYGNVCHALHGLECYLRATVEQRAVPAGHP